jgi:hypothetical protein
VKSQTWRALETVRAMPPVVLGDLRPAAATDDVRSRS